MGSKPRIGWCWHCQGKLQDDHHIEKPVPKWSGDDIPRILHKCCAKSYDDEVQFGFDVQVDVDAIDTPIGFIPKYEDLKELFSSNINKDYSQELYDRQFSIYVDKIQSRIDLQKEAFSKEENLPDQLFKVYDEWSKGLAALKDKFGAIVTPDQLIENNG